MHSAVVQSPNAVKVIVYSEADHRGGIETQAIEESPAADRMETRRQESGRRLDGFLETTRHPNSSGSYTGMYPVETRQSGFS